MPLLIASIITIITTLALLLWAEYHHKREPSLLENYLRNPRPQRQPSASYYYCERTQRYRDAITKRFIARPVAS